LVESSLKNNPPKLPQKDEFLLSGDGIFFTLQGEGPSVGKPATFIRLHMCNLECVFENGEICDAAYTWKKDSREYWTEHRRISFEDLYKEITKLYPRRLIFTGGEPLLQQHLIKEFLSRYPHFQVEIETNGSLPLDNYFYKIHYQINCSPKLSSSGNTKKTIYPSFLKKINSHQNSNFKFVVTSLKDFDEIDAVCREVDIPPRKVWIMPEGTSPTELIKKMQDFVEEVKRRHWNLTPRLQCLIWGNKRGV